MTATCENPNERGDGTLCGFPAEAIADIVRFEADGSATFFVLALCRGHRLAFGEHVAHWDAYPNGGDR